MSTGHPNGCWSALLSALKNLRTLQRRRDILRFMDIAIRGNKIRAVDDQRLINYVLQLLRRHSTLYTYSQNSYFLHRSILLG